MKFYPLLFLFILPNTLHGQLSETKYLDDFWKETDSASAEYIEITVFDDSSKSSGTVTLSTIAGLLKNERSYSNLEKKVLHGATKEYFKDGKLRAVENYESGKLHGELTTYYNSGALRRKDLFSNGEFVEGKYFTEAGKDSTHFPYIINPEYPGGMDAMFKYISRNVNYPPLAMENNITGRVLVSFVVEKEGALSNFQVTQSVDSLLDAEAVRVIASMDSWNPGYRDGEPVRVKITLPIFFKLSGPEPAKIFNKDKKKRKKG